MHYITQLLGTGLHLEEPQVRIGRGNEGWTLGAALAENSKLRDGEGAGQEQGPKLCCGGKAGGCGPGVTAPPVVQGQRLP